MINEAVISGRVAPSLLDVQKILNQFGKIYGQMVLDTFNFDIPKARCNGDYQIVKMCLEPACKRALRCGQPRCRYCGQQVHSACKTITIDQLTDLVTHRSRNFQQFAKETLQLDKVVIDSYYKQQQQFLFKQHLQSLGTKYQNLLADIYIHKNANTINGRQALQLLEILKQSKTPSQQDKIQLLEQYQNKLGELMDQILELKQNYFKQFASLLSKSRQTTSVLNSFVLKPQYKNSAAIRKYISKLFKPKAYELLYRGSERSFDLKMALHKTNRIKNTLTIIRTSQGLTIGGFCRQRPLIEAHQYVQQQQKRRHSVHPSYYIDSKHVFNQKVQQNRYSRKNEYFECHGRSKSDFLIQFDTEKQYYTHPKAKNNIGFRVSLEIADKCKENKDSRFLFQLGVSDTKTNPFLRQFLKKEWNYFTIQEYEVFELISPEEMLKESTQCSLM